MKIIKGNKIIDGRPVARTFGGTIIETKDGERVWKGDKNNYVEDTLGKRQRKTEQADAASRSYPDHGIDFEMPKVSLLEALLALAAGSVVITVLLCICVVAGVFYAMVSVWPRLLTMLASDLVNGTISLPLILLAAAVVFLIYYWIRCIVKVIKTGKGLSKRYALVCIAAIAAPFILNDLFSGGFSLFSVLARMIDGVVFAVLPATVLACLEYKANGGKHLVKKVAKTLCRCNGLLRAVFIVLGILTLGMGAIFIRFLLPLVGVLSGIGLIAAFLLAGIFFFLMGINGKG